MALGFLGDCNSCEFKAEFLGLKLTCITGWNIVDHVLYSHVRDVSQCDPRKEGPRPAKKDWQPKTQVEIGSSRVIIFGPEACHYSSS
jgi:hypothetical protein